jgi:hypothetical protein
MGRLGSVLARLWISFYSVDPKKRSSGTYIRNHDHDIMLLLPHQLDPVTRGELTTRFDHPPFPLFPFMLIPNNLL